MVPKTRELLPDPETPVNAVSRRLGISTLMSFRLFTRAPCTRISSWRSAACGTGCCAPAVWVVMSAQLLDADEVAGGGAERAVAEAVRLLRGLLHDLGVAGLDPVEGGVELPGGQQDPAVGALGHHL